MPDPSPGAKLTVKIGEAAERLSLSKRTVFRLLALGELRVIKAGRSTRVCSKSIEEFIQRGGTTR